MASPFPGMDPYLEGSLWSSVHAYLSVEVARQLSPNLHPRYVALNEKRFVTDMFDFDEEVTIRTVEERSVVPDVGIVKAGSGRRKAAGALLEPPLRLRTVMPESAPVHTVEIRDVAKRRLVTVIEVLSPVNKRGEGRREYLERRQKFLLSNAHLIEIDLLRLGHRVPMVEPLPEQPYFVFLSRSGYRPATEVWPIPLQRELPRIPVPLLPGDPDITLDLQNAMSSVYDRFGLGLLIDYTKSPEIPLKRADRVWAAQLIKSSKSGKGR